MSLEQTEALAKKYSADDLIGGIRAAIRERDPVALDALLTLLAVVDPQKAKTAMDTINAGLAQVEP